MPKISPQVTEQSINRYEEMLSSYCEDRAGQAGMLFSGVGRKVNIGNFENIDIYSGLLLPVLVAEGEDLQSTVNAAAEIGFGLTSRLTWDRYESIKGQNRNN